MSENTKRDNMADALTEAQEAWKDVFFVDGHGRSFDKFSVTPDPTALAIIAAAIYLKEVIPK